MSPVDLNDDKTHSLPVSPISDDEKAQYHITDYEEPRSDTQDGLKPEDPLLGSKTSQSTKLDEEASIISDHNSSGKNFPKRQIDEEKVSDITRSFEQTLPSCYLALACGLALKLSRPLIKVTQCKLTHLQHQTGEPQVNKTLENKKRILDLAQRVTCLILSIIVLAVMTHAYVVFLHNKDVTHDGIRIYPTFMQLW